MDLSQLQKHVNDYEAVNKRMADYLAQLDRHLAILDQAFADSVSDERIATLGAAKRIVGAETVNSVI
jgi:hypothetical protein